MMTASLHMEPTRPSSCAIRPPCRAAHLTRQAAAYTKGQHEMGNLQGQPRVTSLAPQFLVDDLVRSMTYYQKLGFTFGEPWDGFYAIGERDGLELHLKEIAKNDAERRHRREHEHLDAAAGVDGIEAFYERCVANGVTILRPSPRRRGVRRTSTSRIRTAISSRLAAVRSHGASQKPPRADCCPTNRCS